MDLPGHTLALILDSPDDLLLQMIIYRSTQTKSQTHIAVNPESPLRAFRLEHMQDVLIGLL